MNKSLKGSQKRKKKYKHLKEMSKSVQDLKVEIEAINTHTHPERIQENKNLGIWTGIQRQPLLAEYKRWKREPQT